MDEENRQKTAASNSVTGSHRWRHKQVVLYVESCPPWGNLSFIESCPFCGRVALRGKLSYPWKVFLSVGKLSSVKSYRFPSVRRLRSLKDVLGERLPFVENCPFCGKIALGRKLSFLWKVFLSGERFPSVASCPQRFQFFPFFGSFLFPVLR